MYRYCTYLFTASGLSFVYSCFYPTSSFQILSNKFIQLLQSYSIIFQLMDCPLTEYQVRMAHCNKQTFTNAISRHFKHMSIQEKTEIVKEYGNDVILVLRETENRKFIWSCFTPYIRPLGLRRFFRHLNF